MIKRNFSPARLKDIDGSEYYLHKILDEMEARGESDAAELIWYIIENERLRHIQTIKIALNAQNITLKDSNYFKSLMAYYYHVNKKRTVSSSITGKLNENQHLSLVQNIAKLTWVKYPQATKKSLALKIRLYLQDQKKINLPSEETIRTRWLSDLHPQPSMKALTNLDYKLVIPE
ncbi:MAG: hypothetical protein ACI9ES_003331 [Oceanospirillaceae bacterium]|jgi:hypothetical protein